MERVFLRQITITKAGCEAGRSSVYHVMAENRGLSINITITINTVDY